MCLSNLANESFPWIEAKVDKKFFWIKKSFFGHYKNQGENVTQESNPTG
jgi:hypothetical protein